MSARRRMLSVSITAATLATAAAPMLLLGAGSSFQADEFCELVSASGPILDVPPTGHCFDYQRKTFCEIDTVGGPPGAVGFEVCVPIPVGSAAAEAEGVAGDA